MRSIVIGALCVLFFAHVALCTDHTRNEASHVEFKLEKVPNSDTMYEAADEPSMMQTLSENLQAAKDSIASTIGLHSTDSKTDAEKLAKDAKYKVQKAANKAEEMKDDAADSIKNKARYAAEAVQEKLQEARDTIGAKLSGTADTVESRMDQGKANLQSVGDKISSKAAELKNDAAQKYEQVQDATKENVNAAYLRMKEAYERLTARMSELKDDAQEAANDAKANLQEKATDAANRAQRAAHDVQAKSKDAMNSAKENVDHSGNRASQLFGDAYNSIQETFHQLGARLHLTNERPELSEEKNAGVLQSLKDSYDKLTVKMNELSLATRDKLGMRGSEETDVADSDLRTVKLNVQELSDRIENDIPTRNALYKYITEAYLNVRDSYNHMMGNYASQEDSHFQAQQEKVGMMDSAREKLRNMGDRVAEAVGYKTQKAGDRGL